MSGKDYLVLYFSGEGQYYVSGLAVVLVLSDAQLYFAEVVFYELEGVLDVYVDAGDLDSVADKAAKLPVVYIPVGIVDVSVVGYDPQTAVIYNVLISPVAQVAVYHNYLILAQGETVLVCSCQIV